MSTPARRRDREREIVRATRALFDERGMQDAPIEEIARSVGIARGLIYRHFSSKEELFVLTVTEYLDELDDLLAAAVEGDGDGGGAGRAEGDAAVRLERLVEAFAGFCRRHPAFLDCSVSLMRRPAADLREMVSESVWLRLGQGMAACLARVAEVLREGAADGVFAVEDADYVSNLIWTQLLGMLHLARIGVGVREAAPGIPALFPVAPESVVASCVAIARATAGAS